MDNKPYTKRGYDSFFRKEFGGKPKKIPYLTSFDVDSYVEEISANRISGGIVKSKDGKLVIDFEAGTIMYDGESVI